MPQQQIPTKPAPENIDPELIRRLEAYVRSERRGPRIAGLHTSDLVSATVLKLLVRARTSGNTLEYQDFGKLAFKIAHDVVVDAIRTIARATRRTKSLELQPNPEVAASEQVTVDPHVKDALFRALQTLDQADYQLVIMRLRGASWEQVAASVGITSDVARKRWQRLLEELRHWLPD